MRFAAVVGAMLLAGLWLAVGVLAGLDYAVADAGTAKADAPAAAVYVTLLAPFGGAPLLVLAAATSGGSRPYGARRAAAGAAACLAAWAIARLVLTGY